MIKTLLTGFVFLLLQQISNAAEVKYLFYNVSKEVYRVNGSKKEKAVRGMFLTAEQSISISTLAEVMLVQSDGKSMLLDKPGTYTFSQVKKIFSTAKPGGMSKFFSYVFEKFLSGGDDDDKQKVSAAVFRGKKAMLFPSDSSFIFSSAILLQWKPEQKNIPYMLNVWCNGKLFDTVFRNKTEFLYHAESFNNNQPVLIKWFAVPKDSKQKEHIPFIYLIPLKKDAPLIKQQIKQLAVTYKNNKQLLQIMMRDLLEQWMLEYKLN